MNLKSASRRFPAMAAIVLAAVTGTVVSGATPAAAGTVDKYTIDTGWVSDWNGGCSAKAHVDYYPGSDTAYFETTVQSPYLFAACRVNTQVWAQTTANSYPGAAHYAMACGVFDPGCASTQTW